MMCHTSALLKRRTKPQFSCIYYECFIMHTKGLRVNCALRYKTSHPHLHPHVVFNELYYGNAFHLQYQILA